MLFAFLRSLAMTALVTVAIPLCLLGTVVVLYFLGDSLNVMSMMGLMLSVGMVVDNAIVVLENIDRRRRLGESAADAAVSGAGGRTRSPRSNTWPGRDSAERTARKTAWASKTDRSKPPARASAAITRLLRAPA